MLKLLIVSKYYLLFILSLRVTLLMEIDELRNQRINQVVHKEKLRSFLKKIIWYILIKKY